MWERERQRDRYMDIDTEKVIQSETLTKIDSRSETENESVSACVYV